MARTREEMREYQRQRRANLRKAAVAEGSSGGVSVTKRPVTAVPDAVVTAIGVSAEPASVEAAVREEVAVLPLARKRPVDVAAALAMARILDDGESIPQQASAARQLRELMDALRAEVDGGKSKLQSLREGRASG